MDKSNSPFIVWINDGNDHDIAHLICGNCNREMYHFLTEFDRMEGVNETYGYFCPECGTTVNDKVKYPYTIHKPGSSSLCN